MITLAPNDRTHQHWYVAARYTVTSARAAIPESSASAEDEHLLDAFLAFLAGDMDRNPGRLQPLSSGAIQKAAQLTDGVVVSDDEVFPDDVSI